MTITTRKARDLVAGIVSKGGALTAAVHTAPHVRTGVAAALAGVVALGVAWGPQGGAGEGTPRTGGEIHPGLETRLETRPLTVQDFAQSNFAKPRGVMIVAASATGLYANFRDIGYRLEDVRSGAYLVPRVYVKAIPKDIRALRSVETRKQVFIKTMLPLILRVNEELRASRARIQELSARLDEGGALDAGERAWLDTQYERHRVANGDLDVLLRRVDVIPPSLALAQAAEESGWGTSRFALEGQALFGQRAHPEADGIIPTAYSAEDGIKVRSFNALLDGVRSYARNLNTHDAYAGFRETRAEMRVMARSPVGLNSLRLAEALTHYSERGQAYVDTIQTIIRANNLRQLDGARLSDTVPTTLRRSGA